MYLFLRKVEKIIFNYNRNAFILFTLISGFSCMQLYKYLADRKDFKTIDAKFLEKHFEILDS